LVREAASGTLPGIDPLDRLLAVFENISVYVCRSAFILIPFALPHFDMYVDA
jgi:hypothetical protein